MPLANHVGALFCVAMIAAGQVLFKLVAQALAASGSATDRAVILFGGSALALYALATVLWIALLQSAPLSRLYPYMALSFVFVALASWGVLHEALAGGYLLGLTLIVAGLLVIAVS
jgi:drug/metabolite transporter (DMT)-like permease